MGHGTWGTRILADGQAHPKFFREHFLELGRRGFSAVDVSRLTCTFAYEDRAAAQAHADDAHGTVYAVEPVDPDAPTHRADMLWLTWMGEPNKTPDDVIPWCRNYWDGRSTEEVAAHANAVWEHLFACPLRVLAVE
jgi:hypothetical protein